MYRYDHSDTPPVQTNNCCQHVCLSAQTLCIQVKIHPIGHFGCHVTHTFTLNHKTKQTNIKKNTKRKKNINTQQNQPNKKHAQEHREKKNETRKVKQRNQDLLSKLFTYEKNEDGKKEARTLNRRSAKLYT